ncbi:MAG: hypothetical protein IKO94_08230, partial [Selenomonadaceae bacterium]|nr:hypothetical protein [Selenomonadaceae bacterium]
MMRGEVKDEKTKALCDAAFSRRKDRWKFLRTVVEVGVVAFLALMLYRVFFVQEEYRPYSDSLISSEPDVTGFIALSYFGVDRNG